MRSKGPTRAASLVVARRLVVGLLAIALVHTVATVIAVQVSAEEVAVAAAEPVKVPVEAVAARAEETAAPKPAAPEEKAQEQTGERRGRAEAKDEAKSEPVKTKPDEKKVEEKKETSKAPGQPATAKPAKNSTAKPAAASTTKSKLPANLGTVTSTGSGGASHYMSKHDAYSAIAEKHGALAHDAMRKSDKRHSSSSAHSSSALQPFGIHKAGGGAIGDLLSPFRGVADNGLARTLGASMRSIMKSKYSVPAYVASALLGAVALLAFYESPISPLPVPPLPEPPVGRFPPEMPVISPNAQVPFRANQQQQGYGGNQRSAPMNQFMNSKLQPQQVLFPGQQQQQQSAQQRNQLTAPVQQLAANLVANLGSKQQAAQRKSSSADSIYVGSFHGASDTRQALFSPPAAKQNSILSFFGLGGASSSAPAQAPAAGDLATSASSPQIAGVGQASGAGLDAGGKPQSSSGPGLSNSHLINKVKSYFSRAPANPQVGAMSSPVGTAAAAQNPYDQYQRMSFVQALMKDTAFLPAFLSPNRKSSSSSQAPKMVGSTSQPSAASRMAPGEGAQMPSLGQLAPAINLPPASKQGASQKPASSFGLVRAADRIAHALLDTFTSSIAQRSVDAAISAANDNLIARRPLGAEDSASSLASATTSLLSDIMTSYSNQQLQQQPSANNPNTDYQPPANSAAQAATSSENSQVNASSRSDVMQEDKQPVQGQQQASPTSTLAATSSQQQQQQQSTKQQASVQSQEQGHVRKTRSIGFEYPIESQSQLAVRDQQPAAPSKAAQINNVIDFVADNSVLFKFVMNQVGLSQAVPYVEYVEQILSPEHHQHQ